MLPLQGNLDWLHDARTWDLRQQSVVFDRTYANDLASILLGTDEVIEQEVTHRLSGAPTCRLYLLQHMIVQTLSSRFQYGAVAQGFHWLTAILVVAAYFMGPGGSEQSVYSSADDFSRQVHETLGMSVFAIVLLRVLWRVVDRVPEDPPMAPWMMYSSKLVHLVLYGLLIATPVTAIVGAWLEGHPLTLLAFGNIGPMLSQSHQLGQSVASIHPILGDAILWLAGLHAAAALVHHFVLRDGVLVSMLPWRE